jgi:diguanylate cyclase (GGDEF)-like protein
MKGQLRQHAQTRQRQRGRAFAVQTQAGMQSDLTAMRLSQAALQTKLLATETQLAQLRATLTSTQMQAQQAEHLALHDALTGLPNQRHFFDRFTHALAQAQRPGNGAPPCVMYIDLDGFKGVNDTYGHQCGDDVLKVVAARLTQTLRAEDMVARLGGDEFVCLLPGGMTHEQLLRLAQKLFQAVAAPMQLGPHQLHIAASVGIAQGVNGMDALETASALLARADAAMYLAKRHAHRIVFATDPAPAPLSRGADWNGSGTPPPPPATSPHLRRATST